MSPSPDVSHPGNYLDDLSIVDEKILIKQVIAGDTQAFGVLYSRHLDAIYRYVFFRVNDPSDTEDLTEQIFLNAWEALPKYRHLGNPFISWLYRIAHNAVIDYHRRRKGASSVELDGEDSQPVLLTADGGNGTLEQIIDLEQSQTLAAAITRLPEDYQHVIVLRFVEGLDYKQVAQILNKSEGACRMIQHRALITLSELLNQGDF